MDFEEIHSLQEKARIKTIEKEMGRIDKRVDEKLNNMIEDMNSNMSEEKEDIAEFIKDDFGVNELKLNEDNTISDETIKLIRQVKYDRELKFIDEVYKYQGSTRVFENIIAPIMAQRESEVYDRMPRHALQRYIDSTVKFKSAKKIIYTDSDISVKRDGNYVFKYKVLKDDFDENMHEIIIGMLGINHIQHDLFSKVVGGCRTKTKTVVVTSYCRGININEWLKKYCYDEVEEDMYSHLRNIIFDVIEGLYKAFTGIGFVHNDLHTGNIIIDEDNDHKPKIIDYGRGRIDVDDKIYFYPYEVMEVKHYNKMWHNDVFKFLISIYSYVNYNVNKEILKRDIMNNNDGILTGKKKDIKKAKAILYKYGVTYTLDESDKSKETFTAKSIIRNEESINKCIKLNKNPPEISKIKYLVKKLLRFFIKKEEIDTYELENGIYLNEELLNKDFKFEDFIELFNTFYTRKVK